MFNRTIRRICGLVLLFCAALLLAEGKDTQTVQTSRAAAGVALQRPSQEDSFFFTVLGDRTGGEPEGLRILEKAVDEMNLLGPDFVFTIGDLVQGYNQQEPWIAQARQYRGIMDRLSRPWYPVAGNHDIYWRGENKPEGEHEADYERWLGPLWYAFEHKGCLFIVLYSDEGDPVTGEKTFKKASAQCFSVAQKEWLKQTLEKGRSAKQIFLFLHHPRWKGDKVTEGHDYDYGSQWQEIHQLLRRNGNVSAVFGGHLHRMGCDGQRDGIGYYRLGVTGASIAREDREKGLLDHFYLVTVRGEDFSVSCIPVGQVMDPRKVEHP